MSMRLLGVVLAGGQSRRFGTDKALAKIGDTTFLETVTNALNRICERVIVTGRDGVSCIPDWPNPAMGPLGGIAAGLKHAEANGFDAVLTSPVDTPGLSVRHLHALTPGPAFLNQQPVIGLWPIAVLPVLEHLLTSDGPHSVRMFAKLAGAREAECGPSLPNINTPDDLKEAEQTHEL